MDECVLPPIAQIPKKASLISVPADLDETVRELIFGEPKPDPVDKADPAWGHYLKWTEPLESWIPEVINLSSHFSSVPSLTEFLKNPGTPPVGMSADDYRFNWAICRYRTLRHLAYFIDSKCYAPDSPLKELNLKSMNTGDLVAYALPRGLRRNTSIKKIDLRDNNLTCAGMIRLIDILATYSVDIDELLLDEGDKTILDKGRESSSPEIDHIGSAASRSGVGGEIEEEEAVKFRKIVEPRLAELIECNRSIRNAISGKGDTVELNFKGRDCLARQTLINIIKRLKNPRVLIFDKLQPPRPIHLSDLDKIRDLTLRQQLKEMNFTLPDEIGQLTSLEELRMYNMARFDKVPDKTAVKSSLISQLPVWICQLSNLRVLTISNSGLKEINGALLNSLRGLQQLNLPLNDLETIPIEVGALTKLTRLSLFGNKIASLPESLEQLKELQTLLVHDNELVQSGFEIISRVVQSASSMKDLKCLNQKVAPGFSTEVADMVLRETAALKSKSDFDELIKWMRTHSSQAAFAAPDSNSPSTPRGVVGDTVIRAAWFTKKGGNRRNWKRRLFFLTTKAIKYFSSEEAKTPKGVIPLNEIIKVDVKSDDKREHLLTIVTKSRTYLATCENKVELEAWKAALEPIAVLK